MGSLSAGDWDLTRNYGLAIDNLLAADVVLADGRLVTADERHHEDLFWTLRGGGNFGIVTSFVFKANPIYSVYAGPMLWEMEQSPKVKTLLKKGVSDYDKPGEDKTSSALKRCRSSECTCEPHGSLCQEYC